MSRIRRASKAVIPAAGLGTRFLPATKSQPKEMLVVVDKPAIQYVVEEAVRAGLDDILLVTSPSKQAVEDHFARSTELERTLRDSGKRDLEAEVRSVGELATVRSVCQHDPLGLGHAISTAAAHVGGDPFAVILPDDLMDDRSTLLADMLDASAERGASVVALKEVPRERISSYGVVRFEADHGNLVRIVDLVEKPDPAAAPSNLAIIGRYVFTPEIFDKLDGTGPGRGGEIQLTDAMAKLLADQPMYGIVIDSTAGHYDIGDKAGYLAATVDLALRRPDLGPGLRAHLADLARRGELG